MISWAKVLFLTETLCGDLYPALLPTNIQLVPLVSRADIRPDRLYLNVGGERGYRRLRSTYLSSFSGQEYRWRSLYQPAGILQIGERAQRDI